MDYFFRDKNGKLLARPLKLKDLCKKLIKDAKTEDERKFVTKQIKTALYVACREKERKTC